jgi:hypothetical protein
MALGEIIWQTKAEQDAVTECMKSVDSAPLQENSSRVDLKGMDSIVLNFNRNFDLKKKVIRQSSILTL